MLLLRRCEPRGATSCPSSSATEGRSRSIACQRRPLGGTRAEGLSTARLVAPSTAPSRARFTCSAQPTPRPPSTLGRCCSARRPLSTTTACACCAAAARTRRTAGTKWGRRARSSWRRAGSAPSRADRRACARSSTTGSAGRLASGERASGLPSSTTRARSKRTTGAGWPPPRTKGSSGEIASDCCRWPLLAFLLLRIDP